MLTMFKDLKGRPVRAADGICGRVDDIYYDDRSGSIRHLVLVVGRWPRSRRVLMTPTCVSDKSDGTLSVDMTREEVQHLPHPDTDPPVSRQQILRAQESSQESILMGNAFAGGIFPPGNADNMEVGAAREVHCEAYEARGALDLPLPSNATPFDVLLRNRKREQSQAHLRSVREVTGYEVELECGRVGRVADVWFDTVTWQVTHLSLQLRAASRRVAVPATLVRGISWGTSTVRLSADWGQSNDGFCIVPSEGKLRPHLRTWNEFLRTRTMQGTQTQ